MSLLYLGVTLAVYFVAKAIYCRTGWILFLPLLICPLVLVGMLSLFQISYAEYENSGRFLTLLLEPATVALAVPMYKYRQAVKKYFVEILLGVSVGAVVSLMTSVLLAVYFGMDEQLAASLAPRSITTPIAMDISGVVGGDPAVTAAFVVATAVLGTLFTTLLVRFVPIKNPVTKGLLYGISANGTGTAKAYEIGALEGAIASLSMIFMAILTAAIAPDLVAFCFQMMQ